MFAAAWRRGGAFMTAVPFGVGACACGAAALATATQADPIGAAALSGSASARQATSTTTTTAGWSALPSALAAAFQPTVARCESGLGGYPTSANFFEHIEKCRKKACTDTDATRKLLVESMRAAGRSASTRAKSGAAAARAGSGDATDATPDSNDDFSDLEAPDAAQLGRATWTLLHSIADSYPDKPSPETQRDAAAFYRFLSRRYPCGVCARDFRKSISESPPRVSSRRELVSWTCEQHNEVNRKLGKPEFPCEWSALLRRWGSDLDEVEAAGAKK